MTIGELKNWLSQLPAEFDNCELVFRKIKQGAPSTDTVLVYDQPIISCGIDVETDEAYFCNMESYNAMKNNDVE